MKRINDSQVVDAELQQSLLPQTFNCQNLLFSLCLFDKGELLSTPLKKQQDIFFVTHGTVQFYALDAEGRLIPVNTGRAGTLIGDVEFAGTGSTNLFAEALSPVSCLALHLPDNRAVLEASPSFLLYLMKSLCSKVYLVNTSDQVAVSVEEKLRLYVETECPDRIISHISHLANTLGCSRRQLERVIRQMVMRGELQQLRKGLYKII